MIAACHGGPDVDVSIRVFAPRLGLAEDHVTGSAMCAVSPWWVEKVGLAGRIGAPSLGTRRGHARAALREERRGGRAGADLLRRRPSRMSDRISGPGQHEVRRLPEKATYDADAIFAILDEARYCHLAGDRERTRDGAADTARARGRERSTCTAAGPTPS